VPWCINIILTPAECDMHNLELLLFLKRYHFKSVTINDVKGKVYIISIIGHYSTYYQII